MEAVFVSLGRIFRGRPGYGLLAIVLCGLGYLLKDGVDLQLNLHVRPLQASEVKKGENLPQNVPANGEHHEKSN
jgi:hypothetical protein